MQFKNLCFSSELPAALSDSICFLALTRLKIKIQLNLNLDTIHNALNLNLDIIDNATNSYIINYRISQPQKTKSSPTK